MVSDPYPRTLRLEYNNGTVAIHLRFNKLATALRTAVENWEGSLDKEATSHDDLFDSFTPEHRQAPRHRSRATLRRRHRHRRHAPRAAAHRLRPARLGTRCVEDRRVRSADESPRLHEHLRRVHHGARPRGGERGQQLERPPVHRQVHRHGKDARLQR
jgi:hypothetical protein